MIDHDAAGFARDAELVLDPLDHVGRRVLLGHRDVSPIALRRIGRARDAQVVVGEIFLGAILIVVACDGVEGHRDRQLRHFGLGLGALGFLEGGFDPPSIFDRRLLRHQAARRDLRVATRREATRVVRRDFRAIEIRVRRLRTRFAERRVLEIPERVRERAERRRVETRSPVIIRRENKSALRSGSLHSRKWPISWYSIWIHLRSLK